MPTVCGLVSINEVNLSRARLVLIWVTVSIPVVGHFISVGKEPPRSQASSAFHPSVVGK